jgi:hypothetical protein
MMLAGQGRLFDDRSLQRQRHSFGCLLLVKIALRRCPVKPIAARPLGEGVVDLLGSCHVDPPQQSPEKA